VPPTTLAGGITRTEGLVGVAANSLVSAVKKRSDGGDVAEGSFSRFPHLCACMQGKSAREGAEDNSLSQYLDQCRV